MSYVFDSSAPFEAIRKNAIAVLAGNYTLDLARHELGNALWKQHALLRRIDEGDLERLVTITKEVLNTLEILSTDCHGGEVVKISHKLKLPFYDASYVFHAVNTGATLVTEDERLIDGARTHVRALRLRDVL